MLMMRGQAVLRALQHCLKPMHGHCYVRVIEQKGLTKRDVMVLLVQLIIGRQHLVLFDSIVQHRWALCLRKSLPISSSPTHEENRMGVLPMARSFKFPLNYASKLKICCEYSLLWQ